jgi:putative ubiquitin-RnfH superfamily antitoxin RatB of RatAB toxin-antitoxin module
MQDNLIAIEVVFASSDSSYQVVSLFVPVDTTIKQAIEKSELLRLFPEINLLADDASAYNRVGIFGELKALSDRVSAGDRVEIYRPLHKDPMLARKDRVVTVKKKKFKPLRAKDLA